MTRTMMAWIIAVAVAAALAISIRLSAQEQHEDPSHAHKPTFTAAQSPEEQAAKPPTYTVLHAFTGGTDGSLPFVSGLDVGLIRDKKGNLYGTTYSGGTSNYGVVFRVDRTGRETVLYTFTGPDGGGPTAGLLRDKEGNLYGTTSGGGSFGSGTVFELDRTGKETVLYSFTGGADGANPYTGLLRDEDGSLFGNTFYGGGCGGGCGVVFKLDPTGEETVLHSFTGGTDGANPVGRLIRDKEGNLYGTASSGGAFGAGAVFQLDPAGNETVLYSFSASGTTDGNTPYAGLVRDREGNLYGTTTFGGSPMFSGHLSDCGVVFKLDRANRETELYNFTGGADGCAPEARLVRDPAGDLYGTTTNGGYFGPPCGQYGAAWCSRSSMMTNAKAANRRGESLPCYARGAACETSRIVTRAKHQYA